MQPRVGVGGVGGVGRGKSINSLSPHTPHIQKPYKQWICRYLSAIPLYPITNFLQLV